MRGGKDKDRWIKIDGRGEVIDKVRHILIGRKIGRIG